MKRISLFVTEKQIKEIKRDCKRTGLRLAETIRRAIDAYLRRANRGY